MCHSQNTIISWNMLISGQKSENFTFECFVLGNPRKASAETPQRPSLDDPKSGRKGRKTTQQSTDI